MDSKISDATTTGADAATSGGDKPRAAEVAATPSAIPREELEQQFARDRERFEREHGKEWR